MILQNIGRQTFAHFFSSYIIDYNEENDSKKGGVYWILNIDETNKLDFRRFFFSPYQDEKVNSTKKKNSEKD